MLSGINVPPFFIAISDLRLIIINCATYHDSPPSHAKYVIVLTFIQKNTILSFKRVAFIAFSVGRIEIGRRGGTMPLDLKTV
jgi:hypothetical protein